MNRKILGILIGSMLLSSVGFAAPVIDLQDKQTAAGYNYSRQDIDIEGIGAGDERIDGFYLQHKLTGNISLGLEQNKMDVGIGDLKFTDITGQYALNENVNLVAGVRKYSLDVGVLGSDSNTKALYGINAKTQLADKVTGYASFMKTSYEDEWRVGANYRITQNAFLNVNYSHHTTDIEGADINFKGIGAGVGFYF